MANIVNISYKWMLFQHPRLQNVSTTAVDSGGLMWTAVNETERRNRL
jgi:hypothetical protein